MFYVLVCITVRHWGCCQKECYSLASFSTVVRAGRMCIRIRDTEDIAALIVRLAEISELALN